MKKPEEVMETLEAYDLAGSLRGAAALAGCDHKTVAYWLRLRDEAGGLPVVARKRPAMEAVFAGKVDELVDRSQGRIGADVATRRWADGREPGDGVVLCVVGVVAVSGGAAAPGSALSRGIVGSSPHGMYGERLSTTANQSPRLRITPDNRTERLCRRSKTMPATARASGSAKATDAGRVLASVFQGAKPPRQVLHHSASARSRAREGSSEPLGGSCEPEPTRRLGDRAIRSAPPAQVRDARRGQACGVSLRRPTASLRAGRVRCLSPRAAPRAHRRRGQTRRLR